MAYGTKANFEAIREVAFGGVGASYVAIGSGIGDHGRLIRIVNSLNSEVYISIDGITNNIRMAASSFFLIDFSSNKVQDDGLFLAIGTIFYVKQVGSAPTSGSLWIEVMHANGGV